MKGYKKSIVLMLTMSGLSLILQASSTPGENTKRLSIEERLEQQEKMILMLQERILQLESQRVACKEPAVTKTLISSTPPSSTLSPQKSQKTTQRLSQTEMEVKKSSPDTRKIASNEITSSKDNLTVAGATSQISNNSKSMSKVSESSDTKRTTQTLSKNESEKSSFYISEYLSDNNTSLENKLMAAKEKTEVLSGSELESDDFPGSWPMFGTDMRMKIGGYVKADFVLDFDGTLDDSQFLMSTIPVEGTPEYGNDGYTSFFAKETRINFDIRRIKPGSPPLRAFIEGDFWSDGNQFRLRHAYLNVGDFLLGQTWTTLSFLESLPYMIDFAAGDALFGGRTPQIRYTNSITDQWTVALGVEELASLGIGNPYGLPGEAKRELPLLALRSDYRWDTGVLFLGTSITQLHWDGEGDGKSDDALQYDFVVAGRQEVGETNYVTWNVSYGEGSGENIIAFAGSNANAVLNADGKLQTMPAFSVILGGGHEWNSEWSSNLSYAYGWLDTPEDREAYALKRGGIGHVNLVWHPVQHFSTGVEYMWGAQRVQNDALGRAQRLQFMGRFDY